MQRLAAGDADKDGVADACITRSLVIGDYRALVEEQLDGHMVSVSGQLNLEYVPFEQLMNPETLALAVLRQADCP